MVAGREEDVADSGAMAERHHWPGAPRHWYDDASALCTACFIVLRPLSLRRARKARRARRAGVDELEALPTSAGALNAKPLTPGARRLSLIALQIHQLKAPCFGLYQFFFLRLYSGTVRHC